MWSFFRKGDYMRCPRCGRDIRNKIAINLVLRVPRVIYHCKKCKVCFEDMKEELADRLE